MTMTEHYFVIYSPLMTMPIPYSERDIAHAIGIVQPKDSPMKLPESKHRAPIIAPAPVAH